MVRNCTKSAIVEKQCLMHHFYLSELQGISYVT